MRTCFAALALFACSAFGQSDPQLNENVSVGYVMIPFTVLSSKGNPITDLRQPEVSLLVDGTNVQSDLFEKSQDAPVSFTILVDGSGSMGLSGKMDGARAAVATILSHRLPGDDFSLYVFSDSDAIELVPFTTDPNPIYHALDQIKPFGKTAFFDALARMPEASRLGRNPTRAIILLSDGIDNASRLTRPQLAGRLQGIAIPIYSMGLRDESERPSHARQPRPVAGAPMNEELSDIALLEEVASLTGGRLFLGSEPQRIAEAVVTLQKNLRAQYLMGFTPTGKGVVKYRHIELKIAGRIRSVRVRDGYLGTEPPSSSVAVRDKSRRNERKGR